MHGMVYEPAESASTYFGLSIYQADLFPRLFEPIWMTLSFCDFPVGFWNLLQWVVVAALVWFVCLVNYGHEV